ncbi:MAG: hypothetical protein NVS3B26_30260 [Mycobacteriales bacterium]
MLPSSVEELVRRTNALLVLSGVVLLGAPVPMLLGTANAASGPSFTPPLILAGPAGEPSIREPFTAQKDSALAAYISAPGGQGSSFWYVDEKTNPSGSFYFKPSPPQQPDAGTGGGDSEIAIGDTVDPTTGCASIAYSGLHNIDLLNGFTVASSKDCGRSFTAPNFVGVQNTLTDRQWETSDGAKTDFLIYHTQIPDNQIVVSRSVDGGVNYTSLSPLVGAQGVIDLNTRPSVSNSNQIGNIVTDHSQPISGMKYSNGDQVHALYAIFEGPADPADNVQAQADQSYNHNDTVYVGKSVDGGATWTDTKVFGVPPASLKELNLLFPVITVDAAGNLYAAWSDQLHVQYAVSRDHGRSWSKPYQVNPDNAGGTDGGAADIFPWIAAGKDGILDVVWYHSAGGAKGANLKHRDPGDAATTWTVAFTQLTGATAAAGVVPTPRVASQSLAVTPVIHRGDICNNGIGCTVAGDRSLLDFFQVAVDRAGRANVAYATDAANPGTARIGYIRQNGGLSAATGTPSPERTYAAPVLPFGANGTTCPGPQVKDPSGDAPGSLLVGTAGGNQDSLDILSAAFGTPSASALKVVLTLKNLQPLPPVGVTTGTLYYVKWSFGGKIYAVRASSNGPGLQTFDAGQFVAGKYTSSGSVAGAFKAGPKGTITFTVPRALVGSPRTGATLSLPSAETHGTLSVLGSGLQYTATVDTAPDSGSGAPYVVGQACAAARRASAGNVATPAGDASGALPRTGPDPLLPVTGGVVLLLAAAVRRRSSSSRLAGEQ